ncbi:MAG: YlmC/YmxH family sporulation protein [Clostridia bacterium]|nr:YlmC/YmxH family sporulation protein [Clostridia bacterium]
MMRSFDLRQKKVIDVETAELMGYIRDMDIDFETGRIKSVTIPHRGFWGFLKKSKSVTVPWNKVIAIGSEFVIVKK